MKLHGTAQINEAGHLIIGGCDTMELARDYGTPLYVIDEDLLRENCRDYARNFIPEKNAMAIYASKAMLTTAICRIIEEEGLGLDVVSGGELYTAQAAGFPMAKVFYHGNNKTSEEIKMALEAGIGRIVVDNRYELGLVNDIAGTLGKKASVLLRITPGIEAHTHEYIQTGQIDSKFGLVMSNGQAMEGIREALSLPNVVFMGIHCHIGSQIFEIESFQHTAEVMMRFVRSIKDETGAVCSELNLGGGFGIFYVAGDKPATIHNYATVVLETVQTLAEEYKLLLPKIIVEPGRSIVGTSGTTLYTIGSIKDIPGVRKYVAIDGGMTDNPRPILYQARYQALVANKAKEAQDDVVSIAGHCCESGDMLVWDLGVPQVESGDILAVFCTGAYNFSMSSNYNRFPRPAVVLVKDGRSELIVQRETYSDIIRNDVIPERLKK